MADHLPEYAETLNIYHRAKSAIVWQKPVWKSGKQSSASDNIRIILIAFERNPASENARSDQ
jgi:hypothetical protein